MPDRMSDDRFRRSTSPLSSLPSPPAGSISSDPTAEDEADDTSLCYVERIIARSIYTYPRPKGGVEHRYLVRWWGYTPNDDTWEPRSQLAKTVGSLIEAFEADDHPFTILDRRGDEKKEYLIRYGWASRLTGYSPRAEVVWHTEADIFKMGVSPQALSNAELAWELGLTPQPRVSATKTLTQTTRARKRINLGKPGYMLLRIVNELVDEPRGRKRAQTTRKVLVEFKIRRGKVRQRWYARSYLAKVFGSEQVRVARLAWDARVTETKAEDTEVFEPEPVIDDVVADDVIEEQPRLCRRQAGLSLSDTGFDIEYEPPLTHSAGIEMTIAPRHPLILCLKLDKATQSFLTDLRTKHFPSNRNYLAAHVTLFHAIPPHRFPELDSHLHQLSTSQKGWDVFVGEPRKMGNKGVMVTVRDRPLGTIERLHTDLQRWLKDGVKDDKDKLTDQDARRPSKAHVTILNKAEDEEQVERCLREVTETFEGLKQPGERFGQQKGRAIGLEMYEYVGGPWKFVKEYTFQA